MLGTFEPLDLGVYDRLFHGRGPRPPRTPIVIVAIDEESVRELDQWPLTRATYARLVDRVSAAGPLVIGIDLLFDTHSALGREDDDAFGAAVARAGNVVLAATLTVAPCSICICLSARFAAARTASVTSAFRSTATAGHGARSSCHRRRIKAWPIGPIVALAVGALFTVVAVQSLAPRVER